MEAFQGAESATSLADETVWAILTGYNGDGWLDRRVPDDRPSKNLAIARNSGFSPEALAIGSGELCLSSERKYIQGELYRSGGVRILTGRFNDPGSGLEVDL